MYYGIINCPGATETMRRFFSKGVLMSKKNTKISKKKSESIIAKDYVQTLAALKKKIQEAQIKAVLAANKELLKLYWEIGQTVVEKQRTTGWGTKTVEKLAEDLQNEFPGVAGFSRTNIFNMRSFYLAYEIVQQPAGQLEELPILHIPWYHNVILLHKLKNNAERLWYAQKAIEHGWSRILLETWIESDLYHREGKATNNFKKTLPAPHSDMAQQSFKDPYVFDFLMLQNDHIEHDLEQGLIENVQKLLLEMGKGFALIARQYHLTVDDEDYYIDLLFYHVKLKCYVVVELKARAFDPRDIGQLNFYLSAVDDLVRDPEDKPTIGLLLCKTKKNFTAEYALRGIERPIGVAKYETEIMKKLSKELKRSLPTVEEIEAEFEKKELLAAQASKKVSMRKRKVKKAAK